ncbi:hypothetical protein MASR2M8_21440 [Opitutaceae bacterium]
MNERFSTSQISKVIDQALIYQCACPAQVCRAIFELRELYAYQVDCANDTANDRLVHETIAASTEQSHALMEQCLARILEIEGWDLTTLTMPESLRKKTLKSL